MRRAATGKPAIISVATVLIGFFWSPCVAAVNCSPPYVQCLPGITYFGSAGAGGAGGLHYVSGPGSFTVIGYDDSGDFILGQADAQGNVRMSPTPVVAVSVGAYASSNEVHSGVAGASASFGIAHYFEAVGPPANVPVWVDSKGAVDVTASGQGSFDSQDYAQAYISVTSTAVDGTTLMSGDAEAIKNGDSFATSVPDPDAFFIDRDFLGAANQIYKVEMFIDVFGGVEAPGYISLAANVDPQILIAPGFSNASQYSLVFSPGVGDGPITGIPEPSTWAMMLAGFAGLGLAALRRSRKSVSGTMRF